MEDGQEPQAPDRLLRVNDVAKIFGVKPYTIRSWIKNNKINAVLLPAGHYRIFASEVRRLANVKYGDTNV